VVWHGRQVRACIKLVKPFDSRAFNPTIDEAENEQPLKCAKRGQVTDMVTELPIEQQIYDIVDRSGKEGLKIIEVKFSGINALHSYLRKIQSQIQNYFAGSRVVPFALFGLYVI
jgi:hypothetical protein